MFEAVLAVFFAAVVIVLVWLAKGAMLTPIPLGDGQSMYIIINAGSGSCDTLEHTVEAIKWLRGNGTLPVSAIAVRDCGMDEESLKLCETLAQGDTLIKLLANESNRESLLST